MANLVSHGVDIHVVYVTPCRLASVYLSYISFLVIDLRSSLSLPHSYRSQYGASDSPLSSKLHCIVISIVQ